MNIDKSNPKYRPVLTATDILHILTLAKNDTPLQPESRVLIQKLSVFQTKIDNQSVAPAYISVNKPSKEEQTITLLASLGSDLVSDAKLEPNKPYNKETYWHKCYNKLKVMGASALTLEELDSAQEYRYLHDLMTPEEERAHESQIADNSLQDRES